MIQKDHLQYPIKVKDPNDFQPGTKTPKFARSPIWLVEITIPLHIMDDIKEGSVDLAGSTVDLQELDDAYDEDLDKEGLDQDSPQKTQQNMQMAQQPGPPA